MFKKFITILLICAPLFLTGCIKVNFGTGTSESGGIFKSIDAGNTWEQKTSLLSQSKEKQNIGKVNPTKMLFSLDDSQIIFLGTRENGMYVTFNGGDEWQNIFIPKGKINDIAIDPKSKDIIYLAYYNKILKIQNLKKDLQEIFIENQTNKFIASLAIDWNNPNKIYAGATDGTLLQSLNSGQSWNMIESFNKKNETKNEIKKIIINSRDNRILYIITTSAGIFKSMDQGKNWQEITSGLEKFTGGKNIFDVAFDSNKDGKIIIATMHGLIKTDNNGKTWEELKLLSLPGTIKIYSVAINPINSKEIYYGTNGAIYKTNDNGATWIVRKMPTLNAIKILLIDPKAPATIYTGISKEK
ncbi:hypothetical protein HY750_00080 [Candidatus Kuenenbacteria bacterium]|nr:hypothetical protein [Candidatus Kuenenbacteria bacterium]